MKRNVKIKGFLMIEIIIAVSIISVCVLAVMSVTEKSIQVARQALHVAEANFLLEEGAEIVRIIRDNDWNNISTLTNGTLYYAVFSNSWSLSSTPSVVGIFTRTITITSVSRDEATSDIAVSGVDDPGTKLVTVTVSWVETGQTINKTMSFYIMDIFS